MHLIFQLGTIYCIECGATPVCLGNWCQSCVNASACIPSTLPAVAFQPPTKKSTLPAVAIQPPTNKPKSAHEIVRLKRQEAIQQALSFQSNAIPNPVTQSQPSQNLAIANSQAVMAQFSASSSQVGPYESVRLSRILPYNRPQVIKGAKAPNGPASKGIISSVSTPQKISVPCGFEMWYKGRFTTGQAVIPTNQFILWADPTSFSSLINTLCNKYNGSIKLVTGPNKDRAKDQLDLEELNGMKDATQKYSLQSGISQSNPEKRDPISEDEYNGSNSSLPSGDFSTCSKVKNGTKTEKHPVDKHSKVMIKNSTSRSTSKPTKLIDNEIAVVCQPNTMELDNGLVFIRITPPWISNPILNPQDLSWDRFGTPENSLSLRISKDSNWVNGVRCELNLDGLNTTQRICLYRVNYQNCLKLKSTSKIISAEILNLGTVFPMIVKYNRLQIDPNREQVFRVCDKAKTIMNGFPVHHDFETRSQSNDKFIPGQDDDMLPGRVDSPDYLFYNPTLQLAEDEPSHILHGGENTGTIITHFKGNAPFIARPRVIDLNPSSHWAHGVNTKNIISDFVQKHICTQACKRLGLPDLEEIHWSPKCGITNRESRSASINTQKNPEDIKLISFIRQGKKALGFS
ncbi:hypothetical protein PSTG_04605 [Puccinia striiformis f. sp. tritici PST-78]|uniref:Alpha-type protein kinase domain-containing protein n=1 Tax=Puccinia striiformis f. sp. tritici PST-78 TaxID=1165861 RepID=A0A0L0VSC5_9BASI|nr:hypothetical protein PSTG_04605 [Puccinia striiformis f. sp. tritici PST-78]